MVMSPPGVLPMPVKWIIVGVVLLIIVLTDPSLLWIPVLLGGMYGIMMIFAYVFDAIFPPRTPEEQKERDRKRNDKDIISRQRDRSKKAQSYAEKMGGEFNNPLKADGNVYAFRSKQKYVGRGYSGNAVKIGYTTKDPFKRAEELNEGNEYGDTIFEPICWFEVNHCFEVEQNAHELLRRRKKSLWRELFNITEEEAKGAIEEAIKKTDGAKQVKLVVPKKRIKEFVDAPLVLEKSDEIEDEIPF